MDAGRTAEADIGKGPVEPTGPRFICDAMLGGLARWLRAAGYATEFDVHVADGELVRKALAGELCLLTSDSALMDRYAVREGIVRAVFVQPGLSPIEQLARVIAELGLPCRDARCMDCGSALTEAPLREVAGEVPPKVRRACSRFFRCSGCGKVYWHGTHWKDIRRRLDRARELARRLLGQPSDP